MIRVKVTSSEEKNFFSSLCLGQEVRDVQCWDGGGGEREREGKKKRAGSFQEIYGEIVQSCGGARPRMTSQDLGGDGAAVFLPQKRCVKKSREVLEFAIVDLYGKRKVLLRLAFFPCSDWRQISGGKGAIYDSPLTSLIQDV